MPKISVDLSGIDDDPDDVLAAKTREMARPLPSPHKSAATAIRRAERVQFAFSNVPLPIKEAFQAEAHRRGITMKSLLYHCLRAGGLDIPSDEDLDGRRLEHTLGEHRRALHVDEHLVVFDLLLDLGRHVVGHMRSPPGIAPQLSPVVTVFSWSA